MIRKRCWSVAALILLAVSGAEGKWIANSTAESGEEIGSMLSATKVKNMLKGKTFYFSDHYGHCEDRGADWTVEPGWGRVRFNAKVTSLSWKALDGGGDSGTESIRPVTNGLMFVNGGMTSLLSVHNKQFIYFEDEGYSKFFTSKSAAQKHARAIEKKNGGFTKAMLKGKTFYEVGIDNYEMLKLKFSDSRVEVSGGGETERFAYRIDDKGVVQLDDGSDQIRIYLQEKNRDYIEVGATYRPEKFEDKTSWFRKEYGRGVNNFNNDVQKLANFFVKKGLFGHKVTKDGRILGKKFDGYWEVDDDVLTCSVPDGNELMSYGFRLENNRLKMREGGEGLAILRLYYDKSKRDAFRRKLINGDGGIDLQNTLQGKTLYANIGIGDRLHIMALTLEDDGGVKAKMFDPGEGRFVTESLGDYTLDEEKHAIVTEEGVRRSYHRVIAHDARGIVVREPEGGLTYFYYKRLDALEGRVVVEDCDRAR